MIRNIAEQRAKLKETMEKEIDAYFDSLESRTAEEGFDINTLERLMLEQQAKVKAALRESNSELASNVETVVKKTVRSVEKTSKE